jgi:TPR repeat protein
LPQAPPAQFARELVVTAAEPKAPSPVLRNENAAELVRLIARATGLLRQGDIGAARVVLERAAELGSAPASFALAETYDPSLLAKWGASGTRGDTSKARELYARAAAGGVKEARERFDALGH